MGMVCCWIYCILHSRSKIIMINFHHEMAKDTTANRDWERNRRKIEMYLQDLGYVFEQSPHPRAAWLLAVHHPADLKAGILQTTDKPNQIIIDGSVSISKQQQRLFRELPQQERQSLVYAIRFKLLDMCLNFIGVDDPLTSITVGRIVFFEGLTKTSFHENINAVIRGKLAIIWLVDQALATLRPNSFDSATVN